MNISFDPLKSIKKLDLPEIMKSYNIELKRLNDSSYQCLCPFHDDKNPSLNISFKRDKWMWHCFGCHASGSVLDFVMKKEGLSFIAAYRQLNKMAIKNTRVINRVVRAVPKDDDVLNGFNKLTTSRGKMLERVVDFYCKSFQEDRRGLDYLAGRGIVDPKIFADYRVGFVNGRMKNTLPSGGAVVDQLKAMGILNARGNECFYNCVVFPIFDDDGNVVSLYGRNIERMGHLYLSGAHRGVFNGKVLHTTKKVVLVESIIDCLSLIQMGISEVVPLYGTNGLTQDHVALFKKCLTQDVYVCLDNDDAGRRATADVGVELKAIGVASHAVALPADIKDLNDYLVSGGTKEAFALLMQDAVAIKPALVELDLQYEVVEDGAQIVFKFADRHYRIRGLSTGRLDQMRVNIKLSAGTSQHLDTLDLYSARARDAFILQARKVFKFEDGILNRDITLLVEKLEALQAKRIEGDDAPLIAPMTDVDKSEALKFLKSSSLTNDILSDFKACGHVGEENNLLFGYLAGISRKLSAPLAVLVISRSASGKTTLQDAILSFTPPEDFEKYTRLTDQALFYKEENSLKHKMLAIEEEKGANGCAYSLRNLQSSHGLTIAATGKDATTGKLKTEVYKVSGPTAIMITTTYSEEMDFETYNRFIVLTVDESIAQTKKILERQRLNESIEGIIDKRLRAKIQHKHHNAQRLLKSLEVANPYSSQLTFIDTILRARREQPKYLALIKTVALLRQYQKTIRNTEVGDSNIEYVEVDLKDITIANDIANDILGRNLDELCPPARGLLIEIKRMTDEWAHRDNKHPRDILFTRRELRVFSGWSDYQVKTHLKQLEELEYIYAIQGSKGQRYSYQLLWDGAGIDGDKFLMGLIDVEKIKQTRSTKN